MDGPQFFFAVFNVKNVVITCLERSTGPFNTAYRVATSYTDSTSKATARSRQAEQIRPQEAPKMLRAKASMRSLLAAHARSTSRTTRCFHSVRESATWYLETKPLPIGHPWKLPSIVQPNRCVYGT